MTAKRGRPPKTQTMSKTSRETFDLMHALVSKISCQFPNTAEGRLMLAVINVALSDLITNRRGPEMERYRDNAKRYLRGDMWHALVAGVDPDWIRLQLKIAGFDIEEQRYGLACHAGTFGQLPFGNGRGLLPYAVAG